MKYALGLVVGKFAPLHRGHEYLIETALAHCHELLVLSYCSPTPRHCAAPVRRRWLEERFPTARVVVLDEDYRSPPGAPEWPPDDAPAPLHRRFVGHLCRDVFRLRVEAVFTSEDYGDPFAADLSAYYRASDPDAPRVVHVAVDPERSRFPISGTRVRADPHALCSFLSPAVYASFVERVAILGGESSGKTTLTQALARHFGTAWVAEYGRTLWDEKQGRLDFEDLLTIAERQLALEQSTAGTAQRYLFCDTSPIVTRCYSRALFDRVAPELDRLCERQYALHVLCAPDIPFDQDGTRRDAEFRSWQHEYYLAELERRALPYLLVHGSVAERVVQVAARLDARARSA